MVSLGRVLGLVATGVVMYAGAVAFGGLFGLSNVQLAAALGVLLVGSYVVWSSTDDDADELNTLSLPFWLTFIPLLLLVVQVLAPPVVIDAFAPVFNALGADPTALDGLQLVILSVAGVVVYWAVTFRAGSGSDNADTITKKIVGSGRSGRRGELTKLVDDYVTMARLVAGFVLAVGALIAAQTGVFGGEVASFAAEAPVAVSQLLTAVVGYFALGGGLPAWLSWVPGLPSFVDFLGGVGPTVFLTVAVLLLVVAYGFREQLTSRGGLT